MMASSSSRWKLCPAQHKILPEKPRKIRGGGAGMLQCCCSKTGREPQSPMRPEGLSAFVYTAWACTVLAVLYAVLQKL